MTTIFALTLKYMLKVLLYMVIFIIIYGLCIIFVPYIKTGELSTSDDVTIYLMSNGVHTDYVLPTKGIYKDWSAIFPAYHVKADTQKDYVAIGWGDKGFYLNTPTWADLKASTALKAVSGFSSSAMHITYYDKSQIDNCDNCATLHISKDQYQVLIKHIEESFDWQNNKPIHIPTDAVYGDDDAFYEAVGSYFLFYTCNTWVNVGLQKMNMPAALWTIRDKGILQHYQNKTIS